MSGILGGDGSSLVGGLTPAGTPQAFALDNLGHEIPSLGIYSACQQGKAFSVSTAKQSAAGAISGGFSIFNPNNSGKTLILFSLRIQIGNNSFNNLIPITTDFTGQSNWVAVTPENMNSGSANAAVALCNYNNAGVTISGTVADSVGGTSNLMIDLCSNGNNFVRVIAANSGLAVSLNISGANSWLVAANWLEV